MTTLRSGEICHTQARRLCADRRQAEHPGASYRRSELSMVRKISEYEALGSNYGTSHDGYTRLFIEEAAAYGINKSKKIERRVCNESCAGIRLPTLLPLHLRRPVTQQRLPPTSWWLAWPSCTDKSRFSAYML